jgi:uroporphyrinogen decarboxylase
VAAGAQALQVFDSWVGCLGPEDYRNYVLPHMRVLMAGIAPGIPVIHFSTGTAGMLKLIRSAGGGVIGLDWRVDLDAGWEQVGYDVGVQGNLDPVVLFASVTDIRRQAQQILRHAAGRPGHIFNLGHGVLSETPVENVLALVDIVHELSSK